MKGVRYHSPTPPHKGSWRFDPRPNIAAMYVDGWRIELNRLYHRHNAGGNGLPETEYDVNDRVCWMCEARCPDSIWFAHRLQQI